MTGLSATTLEYLLLALSLSYTLTAFFQWRAGRTTLVGQFLGLALKVIPYLESKLRSLRGKRTP